MPNRAKQLYSFTKPTYAGYDNIWGDYTDNSSLIGGNPQFVSQPYIGDDDQWGTDDDYYGDLRCKPQSVAVNSGDNSLAVNENGRTLDTDYKSNPRIDGDYAGIGAYEY